MVQPLTDAPALPKRRGVVASDLAAPFLLLVGPFLSFLRFHSYRFLQPESLVLTGIFALIGLLYGLLIVRTRSRLPRALLLTVLLVLAIDLQFPQADGSFRWLAVPVFGAMLLLHAHATTLLAVTALAFYASNLTMSEHLVAREESNPQEVRRSDLPPLFHFILDEHTGLDGIPADVAGAAAAKQKLANTYLVQGFRIFSRAYSPYHLTTDAVPNLFNLARSDVHQSWIGGSGARLPAALRENAYFEILRKRGYAIRVYQPDFIDLCATTVPPESCYTIPRNAIMHLPHLGMPWYPRMWFVLTYYAANHSHFYRRLWQLYENRIRTVAARAGVQLPRWYWANSRINAAGAMDLLERMRSDIDGLASISGTAFVTHLIVPHAPYLFDRDCHAHLNVRQRLEPVDEVDASSASDRSLRYQLYLEQAQCLGQQLRDFFQALEPRSAQDAIIVLHGDHGSRLATIDPDTGPVDSMSVADYGDLYSAFFAVRAPAITAGIDTTVVATQELLRHLVTGGFTSASVPADSAPSVFVPNGEHGMLIAVPLPPFWRESRDP